MREARLKAWWDVGNDALHRAMKNDEERLAWYVTQMQRTPAADTVIPDFASSLAPGPRRLLVGELEAAPEGTGGEGRAGWPHLDEAQIASLEKAKADKEAHGEFGAPLAAGNPKVRAHGPTDHIAVGER